MSNCNHVWVLNKKETKERCTICGAGRPLSPHRCNHLFARKGNQTKERCIHCGAARPIRLIVQDAITDLNLTDPIKSDEIEVIENQSEVEVPKKVSFFKRLFTKR